MEEHGAGGRGFWNAKGKGFAEGERAVPRKRGSKREEPRPRSESVRERSCRGHGGSSGAECGAAPAAGAPLLPGGAGAGPRGVWVLSGGSRAPGGLWVQFCGGRGGKEQPPGAVSVVFLGGLHHHVPFLRCKLYLRVESREHGCVYFKKVSVSRLLSDVLIIGKCFW